MEDCPLACLDRLIVAASIVKLDMSARSAFRRALISICAAVFSLECAAGMRPLDEIRPIGIDRPELADLKLAAEDPHAGTDATISRDGRFVALSSRRGGGLEYHLWVLDLRDKTWRQLTSGDADQIEPQFSPDGSTIAYTDTSGGNKDIWTISLASSRQIRVTDSQDDDEYPSWSSSGHSIVYTSGKWTKRNFFLVDSNGRGWSKPRPVLSRPGHVGACSFLRNDRALVCHTYESGFGRLILITTHGRLLKRLTMGPDWDYKPSASPDGKDVVFSRIAGTSSTIWKVDVKSNKLMQLTTTANQDRWPAFYDGGSRVFFHRLKRVGTRIVVFDRANRTSQILVDKDEFPLQASIDPTDRYLAYCAEVDHKLVIKVLDRVQQSTAAFNFNGQDSCFPRWSPDGARIAFLAFDGNKWKLVVSDRTGAAPSVVDDNSEFKNGINGPVDWTPNSSSIVLSANTAAYEAGIFAIDLSTRQVQKMTAGSWYEESPSWSQDGQSLSFMSTRGGGFTWGLFRLSPHDGMISELVRPEYVERNYPHLGKNFMVWTEYRPCDGRSYLMEASDNRPAEVLRQFPGAIWPSVTKEGSILFTQVIDSVELWTRQR